MLYFGSFNPVHKGHIAVAEWVLRKGLCEELWFVVSPQNPHKDAGSLVSEQNRLEMVQLAVDGSPCSQRMKVCDIEFSLPKPSYTAATLEVLRNRFPDTEFSLLVGGDIPERFHRWKNSGQIAAEHNIYVYPRRGYDLSHADPIFRVLEDAPFEDFSSTEVRHDLMSDSANDMLADDVSKYIKNNNLWKTE